GRHRQTRQLPTSAQAGPAPGGAWPAQRPQQSGGELAPAGAKTRTGAAALQVSRPRAAVPGALQRRAEPLPPPPPPPPRRAVPQTPHRALPTVAGGGGAPPGGLSTAVARPPHARSSSPPRQLVNPPQGARAVRRVGNWPVCR